MAWRFGGRHAIQCVRGTRCRCNLSIRPFPLSSRRRNASTTCVCRSTAFVIRNFHCRSIRPSGDVEHGCAKISLPSEVDIRKRFEKIGIGPGKPSQAGCRCLERPVRQLSRGSLVRRLYRRRHKTLDGAFHQGEPATRKVLLVDDAVHTPRPIPLCQSDQSLLQVPVVRGRRSRTIARAMHSKKWLLQKFDSWIFTEIWGANDRIESSSSHGGSPSNLSKNQSNLPRYCPVPCSGISTLRNILRENANLSP